MEKTKQSQNIFQMAAILPLSVVQILCVAIGWVSYGLGSIIASLFIWLSLFSLLWYPLDLLVKGIWMLCEVLKQKLKGQPADWAYASQRWDCHFPVL